MITAAHADPALVNLSTLGQAGAGATGFYGGFVISGGPLTVLMRAVGPGLVPLGVAGVLPDPVLTIYNAAGAVIARNDTWDPSLASTFTAVGAFNLPAGSADAALVLSLPAGLYTARIEGAGQTALLEIYSVSGTGRLINLSSRLPVAAGSVATVGFVISPDAGSRKLLIRGIGPGLVPFGLTGTLPSTHLVLLDAHANPLISAAADGADAVIKAADTAAGAFVPASGDSAVIATVGPGTYTAQMGAVVPSASGIGLVEIYDITGSTTTPASYGLARTLYLAHLAPAGTATGSGASGYATVLFDPVSNTAQVSLQFSNLSSPETSAHLELGSPGAPTAVLFNFGSGTASQVTWTLSSAGKYSVADIVSALQNGQVFVEVDTASHPGGELVGSLGVAAGSQAFVAPAAPPALPTGLLSAPDATAAARFLTQATFGPTAADIAALSARGIPGWLDDQMALPPTGHLAATRGDAAAFPNPHAGLPADELYLAVAPLNRQAAWWKIALTAPDQLRQRVALALSEILVVSEQDTTLHPQTEALASYYDLLVNGAFGNFRQLLTDVTLHPAMGAYLTYLRNQPADATHHSGPDENYAREVQQLFTIGLVQLQPDGSLVLDDRGLPIATYDQAEITQTAKVFTGWAFANTSGFYVDPPDTRAQGAANGSGWLTPLIAYPAYHDKTAKTVIGGAVIPAGQTPEQDLQQELDLLFRHPNTGPFLARLLIQRLVTSNPSPGYVYRIARVFADDGSGTRGNLGAVVRAILTDYEARSPDVLAHPAFGKIKEPLLRMTAFFRALHARAPNGRFLDSYDNDPRFGYTPGSLLAIPEYFLGEGALAAPSVFNFFSPDYVVPGPLAAAGLVAPEMQLADANYSLNLGNEIPYYLFRDASTLAAPPGVPSPFLALDYSDFLALASNPSGLLDTINLVFCGGQMSTGSRQQILAALQALGPSTSATERIATAIELAATAPDGARQK